jgi:protein TonB
MSVTSFPGSLFGGNKTLTIAVGVSVLLHAALLTVRFVAPDTFRLKSVDPQLEIILVNAKTDTRPAKAEALAQVSMDAGGDHDQGRAKSPLPPSPQIEEGDALRHSQKRVETLEEEQRRLMTQVRERKQRVQQMLDRKIDTVIDPQLSGTDLLASSKAMAREFAQIEKEVEDYNKRPRKGVFGVNVAAYSAAQYVNAWQQKIERIGSTNYPEAARGKHYGQLILTVYIKPDGSVEQIDVDRPSGNDILDKAALKIVRMGEPYSKFPPDMRKEMDLLVLTRTWIFTNDSLQTRAK